MRLIHVLEMGKQYNYWYIFQELLYQEMKILREL